VQQLTDKQREEKLARKRAYKAAWARAHYQKNRELLNERKRAYRARNPKYREAEKAYYQKNRERLAALGGLWREKNRELVARRARENYQKNREHKNGLKKIWRQKNQQRLKPQREKNREHLNSQARENYRKDPERFKRNRQKWERKNREWIKDRKKAYKQKNRAYINARQREHRAANKDRIANYRRKEYQKYPWYSLKNRISAVIRQALKKNDAEKSAKTLDLLGCDLQWLVAWLEVQFCPGMTWDNYGPGWHIDHIHPCARWDLSDPDQQRRCFHWSNLQPLFPLENLQKNAKWEEGA
jgi:hypothetical protein